jgi:cobalt-zinc-cadmium efflux system outer membrane protein
VTVQVPLFDQNQAQISKARYRTRQAEKGLEALEGQVQEEIVRDLERIELHQTRTIHYREKIIPLREAILEYANRWVDAMQLNRLSLLEAQRGLLESRNEHSESLLELHHALADLERDMGGIL